MAKKNLPLCPISRAAIILGSRWSLEILREFHQKGARKFQDLQDELSGIAPNTLSNRLKLFEDHELIERHFYEQHPPRAEYVLTDKGRRMGPIFRAIHDWDATVDGAE